MVKLTSFLLAAATVLVSTNAQVLLAPHSISLADDVTLSGPHNTILRRADPVKKPKKTAVLTKEQQTILNTHNKYRARHQAPPLTWDATVAASAAAAIAPCEFKHSGSQVSLPSSLSSLSTLLFVHHFPRKTLTLHSLFPLMIVWRELGCRLPKLQGWY
jgi:hypothetical protein